MSRLRGIAAILFLSVLPLLFFSKVLLSGEDLFGSDFILQFRPWKKFIADHFQETGSLPFWNPFLFSGTPFVANIQASMFYPLGFLYYLVPVERAYLYSTMLHCLLGSCFMYALSRYLRLGVFSAVVSSFLFMYNGYFMAHMYAGHLSLVQNYIWIPLIVLFFFRFLEEGSYRWPAASGLFLGVQILGGFPQIAFYTILALLGACLFRGEESLRAGRFRQGIRSCAGFLLVLGVGFSLAAVQVLPTWEFHSLSTRSGGTTYAFATQDSLHPKELIALLYPDVFGNMIDWSYWGNSEGWHFWETCGYMGIIPLCLVFVSGRNERHRPWVLFLKALAVCSLFLSLGEYNPIYPLIYRLPGFHSFRIPAQIIFLYVFGVSLVAGMSVDFIGDKGNRMPRCPAGLLIILGVASLSLSLVIRAFPNDFFSSLFSAFGVPPLSRFDLGAFHQRMLFSFDKGTIVLLCGLVLVASRGRGKIGPATFRLCLGAILLVDVASYTFHFVRPLGSTGSEEKEKVYSQLSRNASEGRSLVTGASSDPNDGLLYRFPSVLGYDPLILKRYAYYVQASQGLAQDAGLVHLGVIRDPYDNLMSMLNLRQIAGDRGIEVNDHALPYAFLVDEVVIKPAHEVLSFMKKAEFEPLKTLVLEPESSPRWMPAEDKKGSVGSCSILSFEGERIQLSVSANHPCYLVLSEVHYPGWRAEVMGKEVPVLRGNYLFRAIPLDAGNHTVTLRFVSWPFRIGLVVSLSALVFSLIIIARGSRLSHSRPNRYWRRGRGFGAGTPLDRTDYDTQHA